MPQYLQKLKELGVEGDGEDKIAITIVCVSSIFVTKTTEWFFLLKKSPNF